LRYESHLLRTFTDCSHENCKLLKETTKFCQTWSWLLPDPLPAIVPFFQSFSCLNEQHLLVLGSLLTGFLSFLCLEHSWSATGCSIYQLYWALILTSLQIFFSFTCFLFLFFFIHSFTMHSLFRSFLLLALFTNVLLKLSIVQISFYALWAGNMANTFILTSKNYLLPDLWFYWDNKCNMYFIVIRTDNIKSTILANFKCKCCQL
jgi:hypothetical protein